MTAKKRSETGAVETGSGCRQRWSKKPYAEEETSASNGSCELLPWKGQGATRKEQVIFHWLYMCMKIHDLDNVQKYFCCSIASAQAISLVK